MTDGYGGLCIGGPMRGQQYIAPKKEFEVTDIANPLFTTDWETAEKHEIQYETHYYRHKQLTKDLCIWIHHMLSDADALVLLADAYVLLWKQEKK